MAGGDLVLSHPWHEDLVAGQRRVGFGEGKEKERTRPTLALLCLSELNRFDAQGH